MANEIITKFGTKSTFTLTAASLASAAGRQSTMIANSGNMPAAMVYIKLRSGASAPTAGLTYDIYLLRGDDPSSSTYRTDGAIATDNTITIENAQLLGSIVVTNSSAKDFYGEFDTRNLGPLGPEWGIAIVNRTNQALDATEGNHHKGYAYYLPEIQ